MIIIWVKLQVLYKPIKKNKKQKEQVKTRNWEKKKEGKREKKRVKITFIVHIQRLGLRMPDPDMDL